MNAITPIAVDLRYKPIEFAAYILAILDQLPPSHVIGAARLANDTMRAMGCADFAVPQSEIQQKFERSQRRQVEMGYRP